MCFAMVLHKQLLSACVLLKVLLRRQLLVRMEGNLADGHGLIKHSRRLSENLRSSTCLLKLSGPVIHIYLFLTRNMKQNEQKLEGYQARAFKKHSQTTQEGMQDFVEDIKFGRSARSVGKFERKQRIKDIKDQIDYYGYEIEPFNMRTERDIGSFDKGGFFVFNKQKDNDVKDPWLDSIDENNKMHKQSAEASRKKIQSLDQLPDGYEREQNKRFGNIDIGTGFFKSKRFATAKEAEDYYKSLEKDEAIEEESHESSNDEIPASKQPKKVSTKKEHGGPDLTQFEPDQLKQILVDLLEEDETPNQAMKRLKEVFNPTVVKKQFKKNQRKQVKQNEPEAVKQQDNGSFIAEQRQIFDMILNLCHTILSKTDDPEIYTRKRSLIIKTDPDFLTTQCPNSGQGSPRPHNEEGPHEEAVASVQAENVEITSKEPIIYDEQDEDNIF